MDDSLLDLSIVIPIYNTPETMLQRCFASVGAWKNLSYEVLLVDDGSQAEVGNFCARYAGEHPAFRYLYKENGGASSARNLGIQEARGRYLTFVDADDLIFPETMEAHFPGEDGADLVLFDILLTQNGHDSVWSAFPHEEGALERQQVVYRLCTGASITGPVAKLYKTQLLQQHNIRFNTEFVTGEDWMFVCDYVQKAESFLYHNVCSYQYFREAVTLQTRFSRFPDKMLQNQLARYARKQQVMGQQEWTMCPAQQVYRLAATELVENLFNSAADLLLLKKLTPERKTLIRKAVAEAGTKLDASTGKKTRLKLFILCKFPVALWPLAEMRRQYLKRKH